MASPQSTSMRSRKFPGGGATGTYHQDIDLAEMVDCPLYYSFNICLDGDIDPYGNDLRAGFLFYFCCYQFQGIAS